MLDDKGYSPRLKSLYKKVIREALKQEFSYSNDMQIPCLEKIVLNIGCGAESVRDTKKAKAAQQDLTAIAGQLAVTTKAKKSIAGFKIREGMPIGAMVTIRGRRMYEFVDRLLNASLPRIRDFQGLSRNSFDGRGNYSIGIREHTIFPEIDYNSIDRIRGMQIVIVTSAENDQEGMRFLELAGMPFIRN